MISKDLLGCATARNKGTCDNRLNIRRDALEKSILTGLNTHLMAPDLFKEFCQEFTREVNRRRIERSSDLESWRTESERIERELQKLLTAIKTGGPIEAIVSDMKRLEGRKAELTELLANAQEPPPLLHPNMAEVYHQKIAALYRDLQSEETKARLRKRSGRWSAGWTSFRTKERRQSSRVATWAPFSGFRQARKTRRPFGSRGLEQPASAGMVGCGDRI